MVFEKLIFGKTRADLSCLSAGDNILESIGKIGSIKKRINTTK